MMTARPRAATPGLSILVRAFAVDSPISRHLEAEDLPIRRPTVGQPEAFGCGGVQMRLFSVRLLALCLFLTFGAFAPVGPAHAADIGVVLDQARLVKLPDRVATIVIGNPLIADAVLQSGGWMVITGKGYGMTNIVALDRSGAILLEKTVEVQGPQDVVVVYRGGERDTYSCTPECSRRVTLGDGTAFFDAAAGQTAARNTLAAGAVQSR